MSDDHRNGIPVPAQLDLSFSGGLDIAEDGHRTESDRPPRPVILSHGGAKGGRKTIQCVMCGSPFEVFRSQNRVTCSRDCSIAHMRAYPRKPKTGVEVPCVVCGKPFWRIRAKATSVLCSAECRTVYLDKRKDKACGYCGKVMSLSPSKSNTNFCSYECRSLGRIKRPLDRWYNGRRAKLDQFGYVMVWAPDHPNKVLKGWQYEHRLVLENTLGRYLIDGEVCHHKDGNKGNNDPSNLELMDANDHAALSSRDQAELVRRSLAELEEYRRRFGPLES